MPDRGHWLAGRVAVVTGASQGIGAATAAAIAAAGAHVVLAARNREALEDVAGRIRQAGGAATAVPTDVSQATDVERLFAAAQTRAVLTSALFAETTVEMWQQTLGVNLTGSFLCCRAAFTAMRSAGEGRIVNIASLSGVYATEKFPGLAAYNVSKYGVIGLTQMALMPCSRPSTAIASVSPMTPYLDTLYAARPGNFSVA